MKRYIRQSDLNSHPDLLISIFASIIIGLHAFLNEFKVTFPGINLLNSLVLILVLIFPGFSLFSILRIKKSSLSAAISLIITLSLTMIIIIGTIYLLVFPGFNIFSIQIILSVMVTGVSLLSIRFRKRKQSLSKEEVKNNLKAILIISSVLIIILIFLSSSLNSNPSLGNTEFYVNLEKTNLVDSSVWVSVVNNSSSSKSYIIETHSQLIHITTDPFEVKPGEIDHQEIILPEYGERIVFILFNSGETNPLRLLNILSEDFQSSEIP